MYYMFIYFWEKFPPKYTVFYVKLLKISKKFPLHALINSYTVHVYLFLRKPSTYTIIRASGLLGTPEYILTYIIVIYLKLKL